MHGFSISVAEILDRPGAYRDLDVSQPLAGVRTPLARLQNELSATLRAESVVEGVLVTGNVRGAAVMECARCLKELPSTVEVEVCELYYGNEAAADDDGYSITGVEIDLEPMLRDAVALALPLNPLCAEDCKGICAHCGRDLNVKDCSCSEEEGDPRWAALDALRDRLAR